MFRLYVGVLTLKVACVASQSCRVEVKERHMCNLKFDDRAKWAELSLHVSALRSALDGFRNAAIRTAERNIDIVPSTHSGFP
jgi:hypothetical protein